MDWVVRPVSHDKLVYVCERGSDRVQVFTTQGKFVMSFFVHLQRQRLHRRSGRRKTHSEICAAKEPVKTNSLFTRPPGNFWTLIVARSIVLRRFQGVIHLEIVSGFAVEIVDKDGLAQTGIAGGHSIVH